MKSIKKFKTLVVATDLSKYSDLVMREAKLLSMELKLPMVCVFVYDDVSPYQEGVRLDKPSIAKSFEEKIRSRYDLTAEQKIIVRFGYPDMEILKVAKKELDPVILIGHQSGHTVAHFFLGSVAEKLAASSPFPLWIHRGEKISIPKNILIPSDLSPRSELAISKMKRIKKAFNSDIEVLHVLKEPFPVLDYQLWASVEKVIREDDDRKIKFFKRKHPSLKLVRTRGDVVIGIQQHSKNFDLIALSPNNKKEKIAFGRVTGKLVRSGETPILILP